MFQTTAALYKFLPAKYIYVAAAMVVLVNGITHLDKKLTQLSHIENVKKKVVLPLTDGKCTSRVQNLSRNKCTYRNETT
jgi:hypothetical protein